MVSLSTWSPRSQCGQGGDSGETAEDPRAAQEAKVASEMLFASPSAKRAGEVEDGGHVEVILKGSWAKGFALRAMGSIPSRYTTALF